MNREQMKQLGQMLTMGLAMMGAATLAVVLLLEPYFARHQVMLWKIRENVVPDTGPVEEATNEPASTEPAS